MPRRATKKKGARNKQFVFLFQVDGFDCYSFGSIPGEIVRICFGDKTLTVGDIVYSNGTDGVPAGTMGLVVGIAQPCIGGRKKDVVKVHFAEFLEATWKEMQTLEAKFEAAILPESLNERRRRLREAREKRAAGGGGSSKLSQ